MKKFLFVFSFLLLVGFAKAADSGLESSVEIESESLTAKILQLEEALETKNRTIQALTISRDDKQERINAFEIRKKEYEAALKQAEDVLLQVQHCKLEADAIIDGLRFELKSYQRDAYQEEAAITRTFQPAEEAFEALRREYLREQTKRKELEEKYFLEQTKRSQFEEEKEILEKTLKSYLERLFQKSPQQNLDVILLKENTKLREIIKTEREEAVRYNAALINQDTELIAVFHEISKTIDNVLNVQTKTSLVDILIFIKEKISALGSVITFDEAATRIKKLEEENVALKLQLKAQDIEGPVRYPEQDALIKQLRDELEVVLKRAQEEVAERQAGIERQRNASPATQLIDARRLRTEAIENMQEAYSWKRLIKPVVTSFTFASAITYGCMKFWS